MAVVHSTFLTESGSIQDYVGVLQTPVLVKFLLYFRFRQELSFAVRLSSLLGDPVTSLSMDSPWACFVCSCSQLSRSAAGVGERRGSSFSSPLSLSCR